MTLYPNNLGSTRTIKIYSADITTNAKYMHDPNGKHDLLGQILYTGYSIRIPVKTRTPQELKKAIFPFTKLYRGYEYCNTPLTLAILDLNSLPGKRQVVDANILLQPHNIYLEDVSESLKIEQQQEVALSMPTEVQPRLVLTSLPRTSTYTCSCGNTTSLTSLILDDYDDIDHTAEFNCPYCLESLSVDRCKAIVNKFPKLLESIIN